MENISEHISYREATRSIQADKYLINNSPNDAQLKAMKDTAMNVFEPLRAGLGGRSINISSFFRCKELNEKVNGDPASQHLTGEAMDLDNDGVEEGPTNKEIFDYIRDNLEFDQLINEYPNGRGEPSWVHVSYRKGRNRKQIIVIK